MAKSRKVIITCAITGSIHTPSMSPHLPVTPQQIADNAIGAAEAGAAVVHLHARNPQTGQPDQSPEAFAPFLKVIKQRSNVVVNITTGGAPTMTAEERVKPAATFKPEVASLNMGTMNFGLYPMIPRYKGKFKYDWEEPYLEGSKKGMFKNTFADIEYILTTCAGNGTRFEIECYDIGHLYTLRHFLDRGLVKPPLFVQSVFGILGGIGTHPEDVMMMKRTADRLLGDNYHWSVLGAGGSQMRVAAMAASMGANVRVGMEELAVDRRRPARRIQCPAGHQSAPDPGRPRPGDRHPRRGARDPLAQGRRQGGFLVPCHSGTPLSRRRRGRGGPGIQGPRGMAYFVYIFASDRNGTLYLGVTNDLARRIYEHKNKVFRGFSSRYGVDRLVWFEVYDDPTTAISRQKEIKKWPRAWKLRLIEPSNPQWLDLYEQISQ